METKPTGRPKIELNEKEWEQAEKMAGIHCTGEEIADILRMCYDTLVTRVKEKYGLAFSDWHRVYSANGKMALRRQQFKMAEKNAAVSIWLGKQYLGQKEQYDGSTGQTNISLTYSLPEKGTDEPEG